MQSNSRGIMLLQQVPPVPVLLPLGQQAHGEQWVSGHFFPCLFFLQRSGTVGSIRQQQSRPLLFKLRLPLLASRAHKSQLLLLQCPANPPPEQLPRWEPPVPLSQHHLACQRQSKGRWCRPTAEGFSCSSRCSSCVTFTGLARRVDSSKSLATSFHGCFFPAKVKQSRTLEGNITPKMPVATEHWAEHYWMPASEQDKWEPAVAAVFPAKINSCQHSWKH